jgi:signal transduction histidine kinase
MSAAQEKKHDLLNQAVAYRKAEEFDKAEEMLHKILSRRPEDILALNEMGMILTKTGDLDKATHFFEKILSIRPSDSYALNQLGVIYHRQGESGRALRAFKKVLDAEPNNIHALSELASFYSRSGDTRSALRYFRQIASISRGTMTEQLKETQREIRQKDAQLAAAGRITTANAMATSLAHQINNPLHTIQTIVYRLKGRIRPDEPRMKDDLATIQLQADRINLLITHLNRLIKDEPDESSYFPIGETIEGAFGLFDEQLRSRGIKINLLGVRNFKHPLVGYGSAIKLEQVFINLIANSRDALSKRRRPEIRVSVERSDPDQIVIDFSDNGKGIPQENIERVFDSLFTTKRGGTGLGLWLCASVVYQMSGTIRVNSVPRKETTFSIHLPNHANWHDEP